MNMVDYTDGHGELHRWRWWTTLMDLVDNTDKTCWTIQLDMMDY